jgi:hypothetical protein
VPFALGLTLGDLGEGNAAEPDGVDPSPDLGDRGEQSVPAFGPHCRFCAGRMNDALQAFSTLSKIDYPNIPKRRRAAFRRKVKARYASILSQTFESVVVKVIHFADGTQ